MKNLIAVSLLSLSGIGLVHAEGDCQRYLELAQDKITQYDDKEAAAYLRQATSTCASYDSYQQLGQVLSRLPDREDQKQAVDAFVSAYELAPTDQARAATLFDYARLLNRDGDPQNAIVPAREAQLLAPGNGEIAALNQELDRQLQNPTKEQITRGIKGSLMKPLPPRSPADSRGPSPPDDERGRTSSTSAAVIPIHFETGSTRVDWVTANNIKVLASALVEPSFGSQRFVFIGHADERGGEWENMELSRRRAEAIYQQVIRIEPSLQGRVDIEGRGEYDPIDRRREESAYRTNRRLEIVLK